MTIRRLRRPLRSARGFSLIEVCVAIAILSVGIVGTLMLFVVQIKDQSRSAGQTQALQIAQARINELRLLPAERVALDADSWSALQGDEVAQSTWARYATTPASEQLALSGGLVAPVETSADDANVTLYSSVDCAPHAGADVNNDCIEDNDGSALDRIVRVSAVADGRLGVASLTTRIGATQVAYSSGGSSIVAAPTQVGVEQMGSGLWVTWTRSAGAVSYRLTRDGRGAGSASQPGYAIDDPSLEQEEAGGLTEVCVRAVGAQNTTSDAACADVLVRPGSAAAEPAPGGGLAISWKADPVSDPSVLGYRVERLSPGGEWTLISATEPQAEGALTDPEGQCADRYRIRAYRTGSFVGGVPGPDLVEGRDLATSAPVVPAC